VLEEYNLWQRDTARVRSLGMRALGYSYTEADQLEVLRRYRPERVLEKQGVQGVLVVHERNVFVERGFIATKEDYAQLIQSLPEEFRSPKAPSVERVVPTVKEAGGLVVIAHPTSYFLRDN